MPKPSLGMQSLQGVLVEACCAPRVKLNLNARAWVKLEMENIYVPMITTDKRLSLDARGKPFGLKFFDTMGTYRKLAMMPSTCSIISTNRYDIINTYHCIRNSHDICFVYIQNCIHNLSSGQHFIPVQLLNK